MYKEYRINKNLIEIFSNKLYLEDRLSEFEKVDILKYSDSIEGKK